MQFVPEVLFLMCLFGWLVLLIFVKWLRFFDPQVTVSHHPMAPSSNVPFDFLSLI